MVDEALKAGLRHHPVDFRKRISRKTVAEIRSILDANRFDLIHTHGGVAGLYGRWAARLSRVPAVVHTLHGIHYLHYRNAFLKWAFILLERRFSKFTDALIVVSEADRARVRRLKLCDHSKVHLIRNGVETGVYERASGGEVLRKELGLAASRPIVSSIARLHRQKGIPDLMKAARLVHESVPEAVFLVAGGGPWHRKLDRTVRDKKLSGFFVFLGERGDIPSFLAATNIFVLSSLWEGLPYALIEAAAAARPIIATDIDGIREVVRHNETGWLVPSRDPKKLAEAILSLLQDKGFAAELGRKAKQSIPPQFSLSRMIEETQALYLSLLR
jgi:glycosyltransferase involved in cell wall biosynthesis